MNNGTGNLGENLGGQNQRASNQEFATPIDALSTLPAQTSDLIPQATVPHAAGSGLNNIIETHDVPHNVLNMMANSRNETNSSARVARRLDMDNDSLAGNLWSGLFAQNRTMANGINLTYVPPEIVNGRPVARVDPNEFQSCSDEWRNALVMYVVGETPSYSFMDKYITKTWNNVTKPTCMKKVFSLQNLRMSKIEMR